MYFAIHTQPCIFPIINQRGELKTGCHKMSTPDPACFTKVGTGNIVDFVNAFVDDFGYCNESCKGEIPVPTSQYNLARKDRKDLWNSDFYDLRSFENGLCHTYNPPDQSNSDFLNRMYFMISKGKVGVFNR